MRDKIMVTLVLVMGVPFAYAIIGDWDRSGSEIVRMLAGLVLAALVTVIVVSYLRFKRPEPPAPPPAPPAQAQYPLARQGNIVLYTAQPPAGIQPYGYGQPPEQIYYQPGQLVD